MRAHSTEYRERTSGSTIFPCPISGEGFQVRRRSAGGQTRLRHELKIFQKCITGSWRLPVTISCQSHFLTVKSRRLEVLFLGNYFTTGRRFTIGILDQGELLSRENSFWPAAEYVPISTLRQYFSEKYIQTFLDYR